VPTPITDNVPQRQTTQQTKSKEALLQTNRNQQNKLELIQYRTIDIQVLTNVNIFSSLLKLSFA
jgi:hypothetical protein